jgi:hypothetical protein
VHLSDMLPLLEGWEYYYFAESRSVEKGKDISVYSKPCKGWLISLDFIADDAYAQAKVEYLSYIAKMTAHALFLIGATLPPPAGSYISLYLRPSTLSTAGAYGASPITSAYPFPVKGSVKISLGLTNSSTQSTATIVVTFTAFRIVDEIAFIKSVRKFKYGTLAPLFSLLGHIPILKFLGVPTDIKEVLE